MQIAIIVPASIAYNQEEASSVPPDSLEYFDRADLLLISSHLIETLHCPFLSNENEDTAASSFCFNFKFVAAAWVHQYLPQGGSIIGTQ